MNKLKKYILKEIKKDNIKFNITQKKNQKLIDQINSDFDKSKKEREEFSKHFHSDINNYLK